MSVNSLGSVGIGTSTPYSEFSIQPNGYESKITLYDNADSNNHYGFGCSPNQLNYHTNNTSGDHVFYAGGKNGSTAFSTQLMRIRGNGFVGIGMTPVYQFQLSTSNAYKATGTWKR